MKTAEYNCPDCGTTDHAFIGLVPANLIADEQSDVWVNIASCTECGQVRQVQITEQDMKHAEQRYMDFLLDNELIEEDEIEALD